jgi:hypothetical protein
VLSTLASGKPASSATSTVTGARVSSRWNGIEMRSASSTPSSEASLSSGT